jgi:UDP:flavonoid glycosyltransferase YjiC (YdhE family)
MARYLVVAWDGAGNLVSTAAVAQSLSKRGHDVRLLGHRSIDGRLGAHGWRFRPFKHTLDVDSTKAFDVGAEMQTLLGAVWLNGAVGRDVMEELEREPADGLIVDCMLAGGLSAGQVAGVPTVALFHTPYSGFRAGPAVDLLAPSIGVLNTGRAGLGLGPVEGLADVHDACTLCIVAAPREFDVDMPLPPNVRFVGPMLAGPPLLASADHLEVGDATEPLVVVSFSTSYQAQVPAVQRVVDALADLKVRVVVTTGPSVAGEDVHARANTTVTGFVPHDRLLPYASLVISHGGLGTVMAALSQGVPMLCVPMGRDQFFNASRVQALGAGAMIGPDSDADAIADAVQALLDERSSAWEGAKRMAAVISRYGGASEAADEIERVTRS